MKIYSFFPPEEGGQHAPVYPERRKRQCDIVITFGSGLRKSITIVEVQRRDSKPDITTFHGWIKKMHEVGAQQLICVSKSGYPQSIIDEVKNSYGDKTVTLMILEEFDFLSNPQKFNMMPFQIRTSRKFKFIEIGKMILETKPIEANMQLNPNDRIFSVSEDTNKISINDLGVKLLENRSSDPNFMHSELVNTVDVIDFEINLDNNIFIHLGEGKFKIKKWSLKIELKVDKTLHPTKVKQYTYKQEIMNGTIAWIASNNILIDGVEKQLDIIFKTEGGQFSARAVIKD